jgi:hypothetical protein
MMTGCVVGRDDGEVADRLARRRSLTGNDGEPPVCGTVAEVVEGLQAYEAAGVERAMLQHLDHEDLDMVDVLGDVAAAVRV